MDWLQTADLETFQIACVGPLLDTAEMWRGFICRRQSDPNSAVQKSSRELRLQPWTRWWWGLFLENYLHPKFQKGVFRKGHFSPSGEKNVQSERMIYFSTSFTREKWNPDSLILGPNVWIGLGGAITLSAWKSPFWDYFLTDPNTYEHVSVMSWFTKFFRKVSVASLDVLCFEVQGQETLSFCQLHWATLKVFCPDLPFLCSSPS